MKSVVADRIQAKITTTQRELDQLHIQTRDTERALEKIKSQVHHDEYEIIIDGTSDEKSGSKPYKFMEDMRMLRHDQEERHHLEEKLKDLRTRISYSEKEVERLRFWRDRADTTDPLRVKDAEHHVFG